MTAPALPGLGKNSLTAIGIQSAGAWSTESVADTLCHAKSFEINDIEPDQTVADGTCEAWDGAVFDGEQKANFGVKGELCYEGFIEMLISGIMGALPTTSTVDTSAKKHLWVPEDDNVLIGSAAWWGGNSGGTVITARTFKLSSMVLEWKEGNSPADFEFKGIADMIYSTSGTNTAATLASAAFLSSRAVKNKSMFYHSAGLGALTLGALRVKEVTGAEAALGASDQVYPTALKVTFDRHLKGTPQNGMFASEPIAERKPEVKIEMTFPHYEGKQADPNDVVRSLRNAINTRVQGTTTRRYVKTDLTFLDPLLIGAATQRLGMQLRFPRCTFEAKTVANKSQGFMEQKVTLRALLPTYDTLPTDFTGMTKPFDLAIWNSLANSPGQFLN